MTSIMGLAPFAPTSGTPIPISSTDMLVAQVVVAADSGNTAAILIKDVSGFVLASILGGQSYTPPFGNNNNRFINLRLLQIDATANGQKAYVAYSF